MRIRRATAEDAAAIARLFRHVRTEAMGYLPDLYTPEEDLAFFRGVLARDAVWLAEAGDQAVGFVARSPGWIDHLYVHAAARGQGVGANLLAAAMAGREGTICLWVFERNVRAQAFYRRCGFVAVRRTDGERNEEGEPDVLMQCERAPRRTTKDRIPGSA